MKLHLPKGLRNALMACAAVAGGIASTLATGVFMSGSVVFSFAVSQAGAEEKVYESIDQATVFKGGDGDDDYGKEGDVVSVKATQCWISTSLSTFNSELVIYQLTIVDVSPDRTFTFNGDITTPESLDGFNGNIEYTGTTNNDGTYNFNGSMTAFTGSIIMNDKFTHVINLNNNTGSGAISAVSATVNIGGSRIDEGGAQTIANASVSAKNLTVESTKETVFKGDVTTSGATTLAANAKVTLEGAGNSLASLSMGAGASLVNKGSLTLSGTVVLSSAIDNQGTVIVGQDVVFDLSGLQADENGVYTLFTGNDVDLRALSADNIDGVLLAGSDWVFKADGTLTQIVTAHDLAWSGGGLELQPGAQMSSGGSFADGDNVTFQTANASVTLGDAVSITTMTVESGVNVTLFSDNGGSLSVANLVLDGALTLTDTAAIDNSAVLNADSAGSLVLDWGSETQGTIADLPQTEANQCAVAITIQSGSLKVDAGETYGALTVEEGAGLRIAGAASLGAVSISGSGGWRQDGTLVNAALVAEESASMGGAFTVASDAAVSVSSGKTLTLSGALSAQGNLTVQGGGSLVLTGRGTGVGTLSIDGGSAVQFGADQNSSNTLSFSQITCNAGSKFDLRHTPVSSGTNVVLNGGEFYSHDQARVDGETVYSSFGSLSLEADSTLSYGWKGGLGFSSLTGSGDLVIKTYGQSDGINFAEKHITLFSNIENYNGSVSYAAGRLDDGTSIEHALTIGAVSQDAGFTASILCDVSSSSFSKTGAGAFTLSGVLNASGQLDMNYEGTLTLNGGISVAYGTVLKYTDGRDGLLSFSADSLEADESGSKSVVIDLLDYDAAALLSGIDLGITGDLTMDDITVIGIDSSAISLTSGADGHWILTSTQAAETEWDLNWGVGLLGQPTAAELDAATAELTETTALYGNDTYNDGARTLIKLTGSGGDSIVVYGGDASATENSGIGTVERDSWIYAASGSYKGIVGGNYANNYSGDTSGRMDFVGDSHILVDGATVGTIVGGNLRDGLSARFTGDTYISVVSGNVAGSIIGAGIVTHAAAAVQTGDTHIFIYTPLTAGEVTALDGLSYASDMVIGGFAWGKNGSNGQTLNGDTNITLDLSEYDGDGGAPFAKHLIGGNANTNSYSFAQIVNGDSHVTVDLGENGSMADGYKIIGGSWTQGGSSTHNGDTSVVISNGTFNSVTAGGSYLSSASGTASISGTSSVEISGGVFNDIVIGGSYMTSAGTLSTKESSVSVSDGELSTVIGGSYMSGAGTSETFSSSVTISGGTVSGWVIGGDYNGCSANTRGRSSVGETHVSLSGGTVANVLGGSYMENAAYPNQMSAGVVNVTISDGAEVTGSVVGGMYIGGASGAWLEGVTVGSVNILLEGGAVNDIYGGSQIKRTAASQYVTQGAITITLAGGTVNGDVYAAGLQEGNTYMVTDSTTVNVGSGVTLAKGSTVSGGYKKSKDDYTSTFSGEGDCTLAFTDENAEYGNISGVSFADFNVVSVASGSSVTLGGVASSTIEITTLAKTGEGTLTLSGAEQSGVTVSEGALEAAGSNTLTAVTVASGATLKAAADASLGGSLTLSAGSTLSVADSGLALGGNALTLQGVAALELALPESLGTDTELTLLTGVNGVTGKDGTLIDSSLADGVSLADYFTADGWDEDAYNAAKLKLVDGSLVVSFEDLIMSEWTWTGDGDDVWRASSDNWAAESGSPDGQDVLFTGQGQGEVKVSGEVAPASITISAGEYDFKTDDGGSIRLASGGSMTISGSNTKVTLSLDNENLGGTTNLNGGTLVLNSDNALGGSSLVFNGGTLSYGDAITEAIVDISANMSATATAKVDTGDHDITWGSQTTTVDDGLRSILDQGIEKSGSGELHIIWAQDNSSGTYIGDIDVKEGSLYLSTDYVTGASALTYSGDIAVAEGATVSLMTTFVSNSYVLLTISGVLSGEGTVIIGSPDIIHNQSNYQGGGMYYINADNSSFEGTIKLAANADNAASGFNIVRIGNGNALGGENTTLEFSGRQLWFTEASAEVASKLMVDPGTTTYLHGGTANGVYTFSGDLVDGRKPDEASEDGANDGVLIGYCNAGSITYQFTGDLSQYTGWLRPGRDETWILGGEGVAGNDEINARFDNDNMGEGGVVQIQYSEDTVLNGVATGSVKLKQSGSGVLTLAAANTTTGVLTIDAGSGGVKLGVSGVEDSLAAWAGTELAGGGSLTLVNGSLTNGIATKGEGCELKVETAAEGDRADAGGTAGGMFDSITLAAGTSLSGVTGTISAATTELNLALSVDNIGEGEAGTALITGVTDGTVDLDVSSTDSSRAVGSNARIDLSNEAVIELIQKHEDEGEESWLTLVDGMLTADEEDPASSFTFTPVLSSLGLHVDRVEKESGSIVIAGGVSGDWYNVFDDADSDSNTVNDYETLGVYSGVTISDEQTLTVNLPGAPDDGAAEIYILRGEAGTTLQVNNTGAKESTAQLQIGTTDGQSPDGESVFPSVMEGSIITGEGVQITKVGEDSLTIGDEHDAQASEGVLRADILEIQEGQVNLYGGSEEDANMINELRLSGGSLTLGQDDALTVTDTLNATSADSSITLSEGSLMTVNDAARGDEIADEALFSGSGVLRVTGAVTGANLTNGVALDLAEDASLDVAGDGNTASGLDGSGSLNGRDGALAVTVADAKGSEFSGSLAGSGTLKVEADGAGGMTFSNVSATEGAQWTIVNSANNKEQATVFDLRQEDGSNSSLTLQSLNLEAGSYTTFAINTDPLKAAANAGSLQASDDNDLFDLGSLTIGDDATITISPTGDTVLNAGVYVLGTVDEDDLGAFTLDLPSNSLAFSRLDVENTTLYVDGNGYLVLDAAGSSANKLAEGATSHNSLAGAKLLWDAQATAGGDLDKSFTAVSEMLNEGDSAEANRVMAAVAGSSIATLGAAFNADVDRQLRAIRNRTTTMGVNQCQVNEGMPYFNAWANAEGDYRKVDRDGMDPGYTLDSWGGTVGFDIDLTPSFTAGMALTAMFGDIETAGPDHAEGDLDTYYASLFARYAARAWTHTFIGTIGRADVSLDRSVDYGAGGYKTKGETDGLGFGLMYELGYVIPLDEERDACLQPVFNVAWRHTSIDGYSETSDSDAALRADDQTMDVVTFGLGARLQAEAGENLYNRTAIFEARALLKVDAGDRRSDLDVALINGTGSGNVQSAELGAVGVELGAGLTIPVGAESGALFVDGSVELRSGYSNFNGTVGYRINF